MPPKSLQKKKVEIIKKGSKDGHGKQVRRPAAAPIRKSRETEKCGKKDHPTAGGFLSSDGFLWTDTSPDVKLIEPPILVSVNYNYLEFPRKADRPPECRTICLVNHGDQPIAFQVQTTDNNSYFVDRKKGVIPARQTVVNALVRLPNVAVIQVFRRPHNEYKEEEKAAFYNVPHKDKMFILLAPQMCQTFSPEAIFHNERCHEKLRIMLRYVGIEGKPGDTKQLLFNNVPGWATWKDDVDKKQKNAKQIAAFRKMEQTILENASKEATHDDPKLQKKIQKIVKLAPKTVSVPVPLPVLEKRKDVKDGGFMNMLRHLNPFSKDEKQVVRQPVVAVEQPPPPPPPQPAKKPLEPIASTAHRVPKEQKEKLADPPSLDRFKEQKEKHNNNNPDMPSPKDAKKKLLDVTGKDGKKVKDLKDAPSIETRKVQNDKYLETPSIETRKQKDKFMETPSVETRKVRDQKDVPTPRDLKKVKDLKDKTLEAPSFETRKSKLQKDRTLEAASCNPRKAKDQTAKFHEQGTQFETRKSRQSKEKDKTGDEFQSPGMTNRRNKSRSNEAAPSQRPRNSIEKTQKNPLSCTSRPQDQQPPPNI